MNGLLALWAKEPTRIVGLVMEVLILLTAFGVQITENQQVAIIGVIGAIIVFLGGEVTRSQVTSPYTISQQASPPLTDNAPADQVVG
jgi:uncharacterized membrane protein